MSVAMGVLRKGCILLYILFFYQDMRVVLLVVLLDVLLVACWALGWVFGRSLGW